MDLFQALAILILSIFVRSVGQKSESTQQEELESVMNVDSGLQ